jgi:hypothetical protein
MTYLSHFLKIHFNIIILPYLHYTNEKGREGSRSWLRGNSLDVPKKIKKKKHSGHLPNMHDHNYLPGKQTKPQTQISKFSERLKWKTAKKTPLASPCLPVHLFVCNNSRITDRFSLIVVFRKFTRIWWHVIGQRTLHFAASRFPDTFGGEQRSPSFCLI